MRYFNILAYNSNMPLAESLIITYRIYVLKNPFTQDIFYVGMTKKELKERLTGHLSSLSSSTNPEKNQYILDLLAQGKDPIIEEIEIIYGTCQIHKSFTFHRELYWIDFYTKSGIKLYNSAGLKRPQSVYDYDRYLDALKENKLYLYFYYCGRTKYGIKVYDEEKMNEDGFNLATYGLQTSYNEDVDGTQS